MWARPWGKPTKVARGSARSVTADLLYFIKDYNNQRFIWLKSKSSPSPPPTATPKSRSPPSLSSTPLPPTPYLSPEETTPKNKPSLLFLKSRNRKRRKSRLNQRRKSKKLKSPPLNNILKLKKIPHLRKFKRKNLSKISSRREGRYSWRWLSSNRWNHSRNSTLKT